MQNTLTWPREWLIFLPFSQNDPVIDEALLKTIPKQIKLAGKTVLPKAVTVPDHKLDMTTLFGGIEAGRTAYCFLELEAEREQRATIGIGADFWFQAWLNGEEILSTIAEGNIYWPPGICDHKAEINLSRGKNVLAVRFISGAGGAVLAIGEPRALTAMPVSDSAVIPEPAQQLASLLERNGHKPYDLLEQGDTIKNQPVIFNDLDHGTEVWMLEHSPVVEHAGTSSVWSAWNADGSLMRLAGKRTSKGINKQTLLSADCTSFIPQEDADFSHGEKLLWDPEDKNVYYYRPGPGRLEKRNALTKEIIQLAQWTPCPRERSYGLTSDNRYIFFDTPNGGVWLPCKPAEKKSLTHLAEMYDGRPGGLDDNGNPVPPIRQTDDLLYRGDPRGQIFIRHEKWGMLMLVRIGFLIDKESGAIRHVIAPIAGENNYLEIFSSKSMEWPRGGEWDQYQIEKTDDPAEMFKLYRYYPMLTHGHESHSPDGELIARDGGVTDLVRTRDGKIVKAFRLSPDGSHYHVNWLHHPRFFVGWIRGWHFYRFSKPEKANTVYQIFIDGTSQPVFKTHHQFNTYYAGGDFSMLSPDATKIHTASSMTGRFQNYIAVMARPRPPRDLAWETENETVLLSWQPPRYNREIKGYLVYRSQSSGQGYKLLTDHPATGTTWRDRTARPGERYYYVVSAVEHSGLESTFSNEASRAGIGLEPKMIDDPLCLYFETEDAIIDLDAAATPGLALGRDVKEASNWYYVYLHPQARQGRGTMKKAVPAQGRYHVWIRGRCETSEPGIWSLEIAGKTLKTVTDTRSWRWRKAGIVDLPAEIIEIAMNTETAGAALDLICLTMNSSFEPKGVRPESTGRPAKVSGLQAENLRPRVNRLHWQPSTEAGISHYNVYAAREKFTAPDQRHLIGSPARAEMIDWGLQAETDYYYAVTAVDRRRRQSKPAFIEIHTPERLQPQVEIGLPFSQAELAGSFETSPAAGLRGQFYVVPGEPQRNRVSWKINIPREDEFYLWLRYLQQGDGSRGRTVNQRVKVILDGKPAGTVGGGETDLHVPDELLKPGNPLAGHLWTWAWPEGEPNPQPIVIPRGKHILALENLAAKVRYDYLLLTNEPSFRPRDGRLRHR